MAKQQSELFGQLVYDPELSYDALIAREEELKPAIQGVLEALGAEFIHFEAEGDFLSLHCALPEFGEDYFHNLCDELSGLLQKNVEGKLLFLDKNLESLCFYTVSNWAWQEATVVLPPAGPFGRALLNRQEDN